MFEPQITPDPEHDYCTRAGALILKERIEAYWRERGKHVQITTHSAGFHMAIRSSRYDLRSDLINGCPRSVSAPTPRAIDYAEAA